MHFTYCSEACFVQSTPPTLKNEQLQDFMNFCAARHAISELRPALSSLDAMQFLIDKYEARSDQYKARWTKALRYMYLKTRTPIYSTLAVKDKCPQLFHQLIKVSITLDHPRLFMTSLLLFAKCTNHKMMQYLLNHLNEILKGELVGAELETSLRVLEAEGGLTSCTKLGNGANENRVRDIMKGMANLVKFDLDLLAARKDMILKGTVECSSEIRWLLMEV